MVALEAEDVQVVQIKHRRTTGHGMLLVQGGAYHAVYAGTNSSVGVLGGKAEQCTALYLMIPTLASFMKDGSLFTFIEQV